MRPGYAVLAGVGLEANPQWSGAGCRTANGGAVYEAGVGLCEWFEVGRRDRRADMTERTLHQGPSAENGQGDPVRRFILHLAVLGARLLEWPARDLPSGGLAGGSRCRASAIRTVLASPVVAVPLLPGARHSRNCTNPSNSGNAL